MRWRIASCERKKIDKFVELVQTFVRTFGR